jgi:hypothetical protein
LFNSVGGLSLKMNYDGTSPEDKWNDRCHPEHLALLCSTRKPTLQSNILHFSFVTFIFIRVKLPVVFRLPIAINHRCLSICSAFRVDLTSNLRNILDYQCPSETDIP